MSAPGTCADKTLLIQAEIDGELDAQQAATLVAHVATCPGCAALRARLVALSAELQGLRGVERAPARLRTRFAKFATPPTRRWRHVAFGGVVGLALAASVALTLMPRGSDDLAGQALALHLRALQPGHLIDVETSNQHVVKPWFDGRVDFAPTVKDLAAAGFPLLGGRVDYLDHHAVAVLIYGRDRHVIDLVVAPGMLPSGGAGRDGYQMLGWRKDDLSMLAISDISAGDLAGFRAAWAAAP